MNAVIDAIRTRRTIKKMDPERMPARSDVEAVVESATWAPNHHMTEPWRFVVLTGAARVRLGEALARGMAGGEVAPERVEVEKAKPLQSPVIVALISAPKKAENIKPQEETVAAG